MVNEAWRPISGYNGSYEVSNLGRVRSWKNGTSAKPSVSPRLLRLVPTKGGYLTVCLSNRGPIKTLLVHHLVAEAFIGPRPAGLITRHGDGDPANNRLDNLHYGTQIENEADKLKHGTHNRGTRHNMHKLTEDQVREIRFLGASTSFTELSQRFDVSRHTIAEIFHRRSWSWLA